MPTACQKSWVTILTSGVVVQTILPKTCVPNQNNRFQDDQAQGVKENNKMRITDYVDYKPSHIVYLEIEVLL